MFHSLEELFPANTEEFRVSVTIFGFAKRPPVLDPTGQYYIAPPIEKIWIGTQDNDKTYLSSAEVVLREETTPKEAERKLRRIWSRGKGESVMLDFAKTHEGLVVVL